MHFVLLSPGKALTDPLFLLVVILIVSLTVARRRLRSDTHGRSAVTLALVTAGVIAVASTGLVERLLEHSLQIASGPGNGRPSFIVVPSGGRATASVRGEEVLSNDTMIRLVAGIRRWRSTPDATLVMTGSDLTSTGTSDATLQAMQAEARRRGVPEDRIAIESGSVNSRGHAVHLARIIPRTTPVEVVSNGWHLRRLRREFAHRFDHVTFAVADDAPPAPLTLNDVIPSAHAMRETTRMLHEWIGLAWYALRP